ncbi:AFR706Cp [Eremothecium gossypii ATCC 10895]|uniref:AFR706Cp n=1 Tax=Eremothecium gossypii (strain ATCC 10895 / CBS 109.51 / FGSC 9923 / NRRL Y-1056) TaxID=284811 RepID=Q751W9_EREGS|nr:AFR706Cp [Eremothecium gossypii ATCC 10895]AAS54078.1 AFR706Cp [Eremothecium gossypii ATCC 10895]AEY98393.1 FAFR706Cp [Eremothecium gossypii FDAG1]
MSATPDTGSCLIANHLSWTVDEVIEWAFGELQLTGGAKMAETAGPEAAGGCEKDGVTGAQPEGLGGLTEAGGAGTAPTLDSCRRNFRQHKITGDVLPFLTLDDCKQLFDGDARLGVKFKIAINGLKRFESGTTAINKELVATLNNLHNTIADKLQEYQSQYARLRVDILEVMKRSITPSSGIAPGAHTHHSTQMQDYFERPQQHGHSGHPSPISPRNHPAAPAAQRRTSSNNPPGIGVAGPPPPVVPSNAGIATSGNNSSGQVSTTASPNEPLKQLRASKEDSTEKILKNAMKKHNLNEADWRQYVLVICYGDKERILEMDEQPVVIFKSLKQQGLHPAIMLRQKGDFEEVGDLTPGGRL